jgi:magnesium chelatase subunit H
VLYALPELDGAIDTIPLGGLVGDPVKLLPARLDRLTGRFHKWIFFATSQSKSIGLQSSFMGFLQGLVLAGLPRS